MGWKKILKNDKQINCVEIVLDLISLRPQERVSLSHI